MTIKYAFYKNLDSKNIKNYALFCDENFKILNLKNLDFSNKNLILNLIKNNQSQKKTIFHINLNDKQNLIISKVKNNQKSLDNEK